VERFIVLTEFAKGIFERGGLPSDRLVVKPNFVPDPGPNAAAPGGRKGALYVGRLSAEKGVQTMLEAWEGLPSRLRVAGDGPLERAFGSPWVEFLGKLTSAEVSREMQRASFLIVPSEWYEGFPMVIAEAYAHGLPVLGSRLGGVGEVVRDGETGLLFTPGDTADLQAKAKWLIEHPAETAKMGQRARRAYEELYSPQTNLQQLEAIYAEAMASRGGAPAGTASV